MSLPVHQAVHGYDRFFMTYSMYGLQNTGTITLGFCLYNGYAFNPLSQSPCPTDCEIV